MVWFVGERCCLIKMIKKNFHSTEAVQSAFAFTKHQEKGASWCAFKKCLLTCFNVMHETLKEIWDKHITVYKNIMQYKIKQQLTKKHNYRPTQE